MSRRLGIRARRGATLGCCAAALVLASCGGKDGPSASSNRESPVTDDRPTPAAAQRSVYDSAAVDLQSLFDKLATNPTPTPAAAGTTPNRTPPRPTTPPLTAAETAPTVGLDAPPPPPREPSRQEKRLEYAKQLAKLLVPMADETQSPLRAVLPLIALETIQPGVATAELNKLLANLNDSERETVDTVRTLMAQLEAQADTGADPRALADAVKTEVNRVEPKPAAAVQPMLSLGTVALCRKVEAFGRFSAYPGSTFVAARKVPMIVYTEVENYAQARESELPSIGATQKTTGDRWALELSQEIHLYSSDGTLCWSVREQSHRDTSQSKRRDFFLVQRIDLPSTLTIGRYTLKVIVRDKAAAVVVSAGEPVAEVNIPISIVADTAIAAGDNTRPVVSGAPRATAAAGDPN